jgi:hypothetical protein
MTTVAVSAAFSPALCGFAVATDPQTHSIAAVSDAITLISRILPQPLDSISENNQQQTFCDGGAATVNTENLQAAPP